jgi:hypothetical protein
MGLRRRPLGEIKKFYAVPFTWKTNALKNSSFAVLATTGTSRNPILLTLLLTILM